MRGRMRKTQQRRVHLAKKLAETAQQLGAVWIYFGENCSRHIREQPNQALGSIRKRRDRECFAVWRRANTREGKMRSTAGQMPQRVALHLDERLLPRGMHEFQDEFASLG